MTKKRFICESYGCYDIYKDNNWLWSEYKEIENIMNNLDLKARERSKALSKLQKENEQLKKDCSILVQSNQEYRKKNEQLKQFKEDVFAKIDMHLRMLPTARVNEFNEENGDPSLYTGAIYMLETLKKELSE